MGGLAGEIGHEQKRAERIFPMLCNMLHKLGMVVHAITR